MNKTQSIKILKIKKQDRKEEGLDWCQIKNMALLYKKKKNPTKNKNNNEPAVHQLDQIVFL